jgi:hypothetical protein
MHEVPSGDGLKKVWAEAGHRPSGTKMAREQSSPEKIGGIAELVIGSRNADPGRVVLQLVQVVQVHVQPSMILARPPARCGRAAAGQVVRPGVRGQPHSGGAQDTQYRSV